jgi:hypothetical protein
MGWQPRGNVGDLRTISKFLLLPKQIQGTWKWLSTEAITQKLCLLTSTPPEGIGETTYLDWIDIKWGDLNV